MLVASALAVVLLGVAPPAKPAALRPSVILVTLDTTRADHLGCYGDARAATPSVDAVAKAGVRFDLALSPAPLTFPSHASLMTGRVPRRHGVRDNAGFRLAADVPVLAERLAASGYRTAAFVSAAVLDGKLGLARGFGEYDDTVRIGDRAAFDYQERAAGQTAAQAIAAIATLKPPFFVWIHFYDPHLPYVPPEPYRTRFRDRPYDGEIAYADEQMGRVLVAARRADPSSIVIVAGDHGESLGEHGEAAHGVFVYQATQRVPLVMAGPGLPAGRVVSRTVGLVDVAPTILDLLGLPPLEGADGRSLLPTIRSRGAAGPDYEMESMFPAYAYGWSPLRALVSGGMKLVEAPRPELYELSMDPSERHDLARQRPAEASALAAALRRVAGGSAAAPAESEDPETAEQRRRLESLGYVGGSTAPPPGESVDPKDAIAWLDDLEAGRRAVAEGKPEAGIAPLERLVRRNPRNVPALLSLGRCRLGAGDVDGALATFARARDLVPDNPLPWFHLGNAFAVKARMDPASRARASEAYEKSLALDPRAAECWINYLALLSEARDVPAMRSLLGRAEQEGIRDPGLETASGVLALADGRAEEGRAALERAVALNPREPRALEGLGKLAYQRGDFRSAEQYYSRALDAAPSTSLAKTLGAIRLYELGDREGARVAFRRALALSRPGDPEASDLRELVQELEAPSR